MSETDSLADSRALKGIQPQNTKYRRPFWLPASSYYILVTAVAIAFFFLVWGILHDGNEQTPWMAAGIGASLILIAGVVLREVILRNARNRFIVERNRLDLNLRRAQVSERPIADTKITLEKNAAALENIKKKSDAAKVFGRIAEGHREVFELCEVYRSAVTKEIPNVLPGSPRIGALIKGSEAATEYHRYHLLKWAEIESKNLTQESRNAIKINDKLGFAQKAASAVEFALTHYPDDRSLLETATLLRDFLVSIKVSDWVEKAERAAFRGDNSKAIGLYKDALYFLGRDGENSEEREIAAEKIKSAIAVLENLRIGTD